MHGGHRYWIELVNAQANWTTDAAMLELLPEEQREFKSSPRWPRLKALAFLNNNVGSLRLGFERLQEGELPDFDLLNPILEGLQLRLQDWRANGGRERLQRELLARGATPPSLVVKMVTEGWNRGSAGLRFVVQRAVYHFARYVDWRLGDPAWPGATPGLFRVLPCSSCKALVPSATGAPRFCSEACAEDTGRLL